MYQKPSTRPSSDYGRTAPAPPMARPPPPPPAPVRLRLVFENRRLLRRAERDEGLRRCWLLLRPEIATVADLATHVATRFRLRRSCPGGVVLSVGGLATSRPCWDLPPFLFLASFSIPPPPCRGSFNPPKPDCLIRAGFLKD
jgi:hypothetical protein